MRLELEIDGMLAVHAKRAVFTALSSVSGLRHAEVELGRAIVELDRGDAELTAVEEELRGALELAGHALRALRRLPTSLPLM